MAFRSPSISRQRHPTTPIPARHMAQQSPISSGRRYVSEEKHQEVVRLNGEYENRIQKLTALKEELEKKLNKANAMIASLREQLSNAGLLDEKKLEEDDSKSFNVIDKTFTRSAPEETTKLVKPGRKSLLRRSVSVLSSRVLNSSLSSAALSTSFLSAGPSMLQAKTYLDKINSRSHSFGTKRYFEESRCHACMLKICLGFESLKCTVCEIVLHPTCRKDAPSCVPFFQPPHTPVGHLALDEYCSDRFLPKLPHLVVRCVQYLNSKTSYKGLYVDFSQEDDKAENLLEQVLNDPNPSNVEKYGPKAAAQCVLMFLDSLRVPLIPDVFTLLKAAQVPENAHLEKVITDLPDVHKNVIAYLILHWKLLIQEGARNGLTEEILGSAILPVIMRIPTREAVVYLPVFHRLLSLPSSFWCSIVDDALIKSPYKENGYARAKKEQFGRLWG